MHPETYKALERHLVKRLTKSGEDRVVAALFGARA